MQETLTLSQDENRYSVSRNAHRNLRRAERARITVSKITGDISSSLGSNTNKATNDPAFSFML